MIQWLFLLDRYAYKEHSIINKRQRYKQIVALIRTVSIRSIYNKYVLQAGNLYFHFLFFIFWYDWCILISFIFNVVGNLLYHSLSISNTEYPGLKANTWHSLSSLWIWVIFFHLKLWMMGSFSWKVTVANTSVSWIEYTDSLSRFGQFPQLNILYQLLVYITRVCSLNQRSRRSRGQKLWQKYFLLYINASLSVSSAILALQRITSETQTVARCWAGVFVAGPASNHRLLLALLYTQSSKIYAQGLIHYWRHSFSQSGILFTRPWRFVHRLLYPSCIFARLKMWSDALSKLELY